MGTSLDERKGWPPEFAFLLERHPRLLWTESRNGTVLLWLDVHDGFRRQSERLRSATDDYRAGATTAHQLAVRVAPELDVLIPNLRGHHLVEDHHYFPMLRAAEPRIARGLDTLERDHVELERSIACTTHALGEFLRAAHASPAVSNDATRHAADRYIDASEQLTRRLRRHLTDEEDLAIPLLIDRGQPAPDVTNR